MASAPKTYRNEGAVKDHIKQLLKKRQWFFWMPPANGYGKTGIADINALRAGVFLAIEAKFGTNKPTPMQRGFLHSINAENGIAIVVNDKNIDKFERWLDLFDETTDQVKRLGIKEGKPTDEQGAEMLDCLKTLTELML